MKIKLKSLNNIARKLGFIVIINVDLENKDTVAKAKPTEIIITRWKKYLKMFG